MQARLQHEAPTLAPNKDEHLSCVRHSGFAARIGSRFSSLAVSHKTQKREGLWEEAGSGNSLVARCGMGGRNVVGGGGQVDLFCPFGETGRGADRTLKSLEIGEGRYDCSPHEKGASLIPLPLWQSSRLCRSIQSSFL